MGRFYFGVEITWLVFIFAISCRKEPVKYPAPPAPISLTAATINELTFTENSGINNKPVISFRFSRPVKQSSVTTGITLSDANGAATSFTSTLSNGDSVITIHPVALNYLTKYTVTIATSLESKDGGKLSSPQTKVFATGIDSSRKFPAITDAELLTKVQQQTFKYFWDFAHPTSGLAREGSKHSANTVTTGGSGFGIMAIVVGVERSFITRPDAVQRVQAIVDFLSQKCQRWHGAFSHWIDGETGATIAFGNNNGADIVETSFLMQGMLTARQYFNRSSASESNLRDSINKLWNAVEWNKFTQNGAWQSLYWQYNPTGTDTWNIPVSGWNEALITYVLAASSNNHSITKEVYDMGWARNGAMKNGATYYNYVLPLGPNLGGPLFFEHYSFLGLNPTNISDVYAKYSEQTTNHTLINYNYCKANPMGWYGYSDSVWGLTASNIRNGYKASSPTNDLGYIAPTAAISSIPYTPNESMAALKFYYYVLGDQLWGDYGFTDAFTLDVLKNNGAWFADSYLAIDQGPIIAMIENHRTGLLWNLFMSAPEVQAGLAKLGFAGV